MCTTLAALSNTWQAHDLVICIWHIQNDQFQYSREPLWWSLLGKHADWALHSPHLSDLFANNNNNYFYNINRFNRTYKREDKAETKCDGKIQSLFAVPRLAVVSGKVFLFSPRHCCHSGWVYVCVVCVCLNTVHTEVCWISSLIVWCMALSNHQCLVFLWKGWRVEEGLLFNFTLASGCYCRWWCSSVIPVGFLCLCNPIVTWSLS